MGWKNIKINPGEKSLKAPFAIYLDLEFLLKKEQSREVNNNNDIEEPHTEKKVKHEPSGWPVFTRCSFDKKENKLNYYRGKDLLKNCVKSWNSVQWK